MIREELQHDFHNEQGISWINSQGEPDIDYVMWLEDKILATKNLSLPPAEGADPKKVQWSGYGELGNISQKPLQPTAEGAEEILDRYLRDYPWQHWGRENALKAMQEFATLHAQKLADKMVSERDDDVFDKMNCLIGYLERWLNNPQSNNPPAELRSVIDEAIEYLKSQKP